MTQEIEISVEKLFKKLGPNQALDGVSTLFEQARMHGVIGPEGAGKTTLFRMMVGLLQADRGLITYMSDGRKTNLSQIRAQVSYMPQSQSLYPDLSVLEHLEFFREMYRLNPGEYKEKKERLLEITRLTQFQNRSASQLSGGMYKKLGLMCALMSSPRVLLLDEPTNGVDPISRREFWDLLYQLRDDRILIIVATSYMDEAERCSKVHLLSQGHLIGSGEPRDLLKERGVRTFDEYFLQFDEEAS